MLEASGVSVRNIRVAVTKLPERNLDVLRAIAVLLVLGDHATAAAGVNASGGWNWNWALGRLGVLFFFVHTSLVLMSSLERGGGAPGWVKRFYIRRAFRIYPLAVVLVLAAAALRLPAHVTWNGSDMVRGFPTISTLTSNLLLVQNVTGRPDMQGVLWSLPLEAQMYLLLPLCYVLARRGARDVATLVAAATALALAMTNGLPEIVPGLWRLSVFTFGPCFISGVIAYHILRRCITWRLAAWTWPCVIAFIALSFALTLPTAERPDLGWWPCLLLGLAIPFVTEMRASPWTRTAHIVAKYSYGIYLVHVPLLWVWLRLIPDVSLWARWTGFAVSCMIVPVLLYRTIEEPMIRFGNAVVRQAPRHEGTVVAPVAG